MDGNKQTPGAADTQLQDGSDIHICATCGKPKEMLISGVFGKEPFTVPLLCDCEIAAEQKQKALEEERRREECFAGNNFFSSATFAADDGHTPEQAAVCRRFAETFDVTDAAGLLLWGNTGAGKSFMASCIANTVIDAGYAALSVDIPYVARLMESSFEDRAANLQHILSADLLVIEDLGAARMTEYMMEQTYTLIDGRYKSGKPMVITTNFSLSAMTKTAAGNPWLRIFDRILERCYPVEFPAASRRRKNGYAMQKAMEKRLAVTR